MGSCNSTHGAFVEEPYVEIPLEPPDNLVIVPHNDLEAMRTTPPTKLLDGSLCYKSGRHIILFNDKEQRIVRVFKSNEVYLCPSCGAPDGTSNRSAKLGREGAKATPQRVYKTAYGPENFIVKNGAFHFHYRTNLRIPCICSQGHISHHFYGNQCECGWPSYYLKGKVKIDKLRQKP